MKKIIGIVIYIVPLLLVNCTNLQNEKKQGQRDAKKEVNMEALVETIVYVNGMTCSGCENAIETGLKEMTGVTEVKASHVDSTAHVVYDSTVISLATIEENIAQTGYKVIKGANK